MKHAKLSASGAERWLNCPGSVLAEEGLPNKSSAFADEGSAAHELAEMVLKHQINYAEDWLDKPLIEHNAVTATQEMVDNVQEYCNFVRSFKGQLFPEIRVCFDHIVPGGFGTSDASIIDNESKSITIIDLKYGKGVKVFAEDNPQLKLYALGALEHFHFMLDEIETVTAIIHQPRLDHISEHTYKIKELLKWGEWCALQALKALEPEAERLPGEKQCQWCKAKATCPALKKHTEDIIMNNFEDLDNKIVSPSQLNNEQLKTIMDQSGLIKSWLDSVEGHIKEKLESGETFTGYKLVEGRSLRVWRDEESAAKELVNIVGDEKAYIKKLISPAQAEKELGKKNVKNILHLINKPAGKPSLAKESDKRPAINVQVNDFENLET